MFLYRAGEIALLPQAQADPHPLTSAFASDYDSPSSLKLPAMHLHPRYARLGEQSLAGMFGFFCWILQRRALRQSLFDALRARFGVNRVFQHIVNSARASL
jgi:hypothetical protein